MPLEADAVIEVLLRNRLRITGVAVAAVRDVHAADDLFQQMVLAALQHRDQFTDPAHVVGWAVQTVRHRAMDLARRRNRHPLPDDVFDQLAAEWADPAVPCPSDRAEALHRCLGRMNQPTRELLGLRYDDGLSVKAIAARIGRTADAVYQTLSRAHRALKACVERELLPPDPEPSEVRA